MKNTRISVDGIADMLAFLPMESINSASELNGKKITEETIYICVKTLLQQGRMIDANTKPEVGVTNFPQGNIFPAGATRYVKGLRLLVDKTTGAGVTPATGNYKDAAQPALANGEFKIVQGTETFSTSVSDLNNGKASTGNDEDFREPMPFKFRPQVPFEIFLLPVGGAMPADTAVKLEIRCYVVTDPSNA